MEPLIEKKQTNIEMNIATPKPPRKAVKLQSSIKFRQAPFIAKLQKLASLENNFGPITQRHQSNDLAY